VDYARVTSVGPNASGSGRDPTTSPPPLASKVEPAQKARDTAERSERGNGKTEPPEHAVRGRASKPPAQAGVKPERPESAPHTKAKARRLGRDANEHHDDDDLATLSPAGRQTLRRVLASLSTADPLGLLRAVRTGAAGLMVHELERGFDAVIARLQDVARDHYGLSVDDIQRQVAGGIQDVLDRRARAAEVKWPDLGKGGKPSATCANTRLAIEALGIDCKYEILFTIASW
jgi:hypothetical protein